MLDQKKMQHRLKGSSIFFEEPIDYRRNEKGLIDKILNVDCIGNKGMSLIEDKSVDLILCDLPYGITRNKFDVVIPFDKLWEEYNRIIKPGKPIILFGSYPFDIELAMSNLDKLKDEWIWEKPRATGHLNAKRVPMKAHESILIFNGNHILNPEYLRYTGISDSYISFKEKYIYEGESFAEKVIKHSSDTQKSSIHPHQKPVSLLEILICLYSNERDIVLDNTIGSGSTAIACIKSNRHFIGMEKDKKNYLEAKERKRLFLVEYSPLQGVA